MRNQVIETIFSYAKTDKKIFFITGDAGYGVLDSYQKQYPRRFLNLGVAEQNMISFAAGLALSGYKVFVYNIAPFILYRCYEQVRNDIGYQNLAVTLIGIGSGLTYAPQGVTHYSIEDIAVAKTIPNLVILSPSDQFEAKECIHFAYRKKLPVYIRIPKSGEPPIHTQTPSSIEKPIILQKGKKVALLFHGSVGIEAVHAAERIDSAITLISMPMLSPVDFSALNRALKGSEYIVTVEEHFREGGLGSTIAEWITKYNLQYKLLRLGIKNEFIHAVKNNAGMREYYQINATKIAATIKTLLK